MVVAMSRRGGGSSGRGATVLSLGSHSGACSKVNSVNIVSHNSEEIGKWT